MRECLHWLQKMQNKSNNFESLDSPVSMITSSALYFHFYLHSFFGIPYKDELCRTLHAVFHVPHVRFKY
jgi:hypothetical protein